MPDAEQFLKLHTYEGLVCTCPCFLRRQHVLATDADLNLKRIQASVSSEFPTLEPGAQLGPLPAAPALCQLKRGPVIISDKRLELFKNESKRCIIREAARFYCHSRFIQPKMQTGSSSSVSSDTSGTNKPKYLGDKRAEFKRAENPVKAVIDLSCSTWCVRLIRLSETDAANQLNVRRKCLNAIKHDG